MIAPSAGRRRERRVLLVLLLVLLAALKLGFNPGLGRNSLDGDYYYQIARHVAAGDGLVTSVSLYHQGFKTLPHPTPIYPLWPLLLGGSGRLLSLPRAAALMPELLYLLSLVLLYPLANRLMRRIRGGQDDGLVAGGRIDAGHAAVALFGLNHVFFNFTSLPYTEGLAFTLLFGLLLTIDRAVEHRPWLWAALAGALAAIAYMSRSQMIGSIVAVPAAFGLAAVASRRYRIAALLSIATILVTLLPWVAHVVSISDPFNPRVFISVGAYRETPELERFQWTVDVESTWELFVDRLSGIPAAFDPRSASSYVASFGLVALLVPWGLAHLAYRRDLRRRLVDGLKSPTALPIVTAFVTSAVALAPLQLSHSRYLAEWRFAHRHGLPLILLVLLALCYLVSHGGERVRRIALILVAASVLTGLVGSAELLTRDFDSGLQGSEPELVEWLEEQPGKPIVVTTMAQTLSVFSRAGFHWMECRESAQQVQRLIDYVGVDYVLVYGEEEICAFASELEHYPLAAAFGNEQNGIRAFAVRQPDGG